MLALMKSAAAQGTQSRCVCFFCGTNSPNDVFQVAQLHNRMQAAASRGAEEVDQLRGGYEDRMSAMRAELQQQEVDKAALLDIVQVRQAVRYISSFGEHNISDLHVHNAEGGSFCCLT
jgi:hypothetical protein